MNIQDIMRRDFEEAECDRADGRDKSRLAVVEEIAAGIIAGLAVALTLYLCGKYCQMQSEMARGGTSAVHAEGVAE